MLNAPFPESSNSQATSQLTVRSPKWSTRQLAWLKLFGLGAGMAITWLVVLPWVATIKPLAEHIERMKRQDIAVEAMFYTDLNWQPPDGAAWRH
jgi:hypothetical protein